MKYRLLSFLACLWVLQINAQGNSVSTDSKAKFDAVTDQVVRLLQDGHYSPQPIDDSFSAKVFKSYLEDLDGEKGIFLASDIHDLNKYKFRIDDELLAANNVSFFEIYKVYRRRLTEASQIFNSILSRPFDFTVNENVEMDASKLSYPANEAALREIWRKRLKYMVLTRFSDLQDEREKNKDNKGYVVKADSTLERECREQVGRQMSRYFNTRVNRETIDDNFSMFINAVTGLMDPHTNYFPPIDLRSFNESMSGRIYGIGAQLKEDDGKIKIVSLVTGGPAWKSGELNENDEIMKVGQGSDEPVDVSGYSVSEAVKLIKGSEKGSIVTLTIKKVDGSIKVISLVRDQINLDETFAKSAIIRKEGKKIGYIYLPEFYIDFERPNGARCSVDIAKELDKLKEENIDGIVMDLRGNGGGSLPEVVNMVGLFIEDGPVCQVKSRYDEPSLLRDKDKRIQYDGPLAVMVDETSASASEIFAAAIQDYKRGVIIGSTSTYGKGTVQRNIPIGKPTYDDNGNSLLNEELGALKLTLQKFYRINGGATQLRGVTPDIILPDRMEYLKFREKDNPSALPWDEINQASYSVWKIPGQDEAVSTYKAQLSGNPLFSKIGEQVAWLEKFSDKEYSLNLIKYKEEQKLFKDAIKQVDDLSKLKQPLDIVNIAKDTVVFSGVKDKTDKNRQWLKRVGDDVYVAEAVKLVSEIVANKKSKGKFSGR